MTKTDAERWNTRYLQDDRYSTFIRRGHSWWRTRSLTEVWTGFGRGHGPGGQRGVPARTRPARGRCGHLISRSHGKPGSAYQT